MSKPLYTLFLCISMLLLSACLQNAESDRIPVRYTILVRDSYTGESIEGADVALTGEDETERTLKTNDAGKAAQSFGISDSMKAERAGGISCARLHSSVIPLQ